MKKIACFLLFLLVQNYLIAQRTEKFSEEPTEFLKQLEEMMTQSKTKDMVETTSDFKKNYKAGIFTEQEVKTLIATCNAMQGQRLSPNPYYKNYLNVLNVFKKTTTNNTYFTSWHDILNKMLSDIDKRRIAPIEVFLDFSIDFFDKNALKYSGNGTSWHFVAPKFDILYEDKKPTIAFEKLDLICKGKKDSSIIIGTKGAFSPIDQVFKGEGGQVNWTRFDLKEVFCIIKSTYQIDTKKSIYEVPKTTLHYPQLFPDKDIEGAFEDKLVTENISEASYPRFKSADNILEINNLGQGIKYLGGFRLEGTTVRGFGNKERKAVISIFDEKLNQKFKGSSELFTIRKGERIVGERVESVIYFGKDSVFHPSVNFRIEIPKRELRLSRGSRGSDRNPFYDSYHKTNIDSDKIDWYLAKDSIVIGEKNFTSTGVLTRVEMESFKYFDDADYRRLQSTGSTNPIAILKLVYVDERKKVIDASVYAKRLNPSFDVQQIQSLLYDLVAKGFINYDAENQTITIRDKTIHYADASLKKVDYDALKVVSESEKSNAWFNLYDKKLTIQGVSNMELSTKQKVGFRPSGGTIQVKENRNMDFSGKMFCGYTTMIGKNYHFDYDKFQVDMDSVRYFDLYIPTGAVDALGQNAAKGIGSRVEYASGILLVDAPNNKSGRDEIAMFPSFQSKGNSYVFYDKKATQDSVYRRDSFFFKLDKFSFNHADAYVKEDVLFKGTMKSAKIFPDFNEVLSIQDDLSLGFKTNTPPEGYPAYTGKGNFKGQILLSNKGYQGKGTVTYIGATINSEDIIFKPKQMLASARKFDLEEDRKSSVQVPQVKGEDVNIDWRPYRDSMYITTKEKPFAMFKANDHSLNGTIILTPRGVRGRGLFDWTKGAMTSKLFSFGAYSTESDTMNLQIKVVGASDLAFDTKNISGKADFDEQIGRFKANSDKISTTMPYNQYSTSMSEFNWDMKNETVTFKSDEKKLATFLCTDKQQDSLQFKGKTALYNLKTYQLRIGGVPFINSCDALIYPETGDVEIKPGGIMTTLENAKIVADTTSKYHVINRATVNVAGKKSYTAKGFYEYNIGKKKQEILFSNIVGARVGKGQASEKKTATRATGEVVEKDSFLIDFKTEFRGQISLNAESKNLNFKGYASLNAPKLPYKEWFTINCEADKKDLAIKYDVPKNYQEEPLRTGIYLSKETGVLYPSVVMPLFQRKDRDFLDTRGLLKYNFAKDQFYFGDSAKVANIGNNNIKRGNLLTFNNKDGKVQGEGKFNICSGAKGVKIAAAGNCYAQFFKPESDTVTLQMIDYQVFADMMIGLDFYVPEKLLNVIINDFAIGGIEMTDVDYAREQLFYEKALAEIIPDDNEWSKAVNGLKEKSLEINKKYNKFPFLFSKIPMKWNIETQSFVSTRDNNSLASINGEKINKIVPSSYFEFRQLSNEDDRVYFYIKTISDTYYFFGYKQGIMSTVSNNPKYMETLTALKKDEKSKKLPSGDPYEIQVEEITTVNAFIERVRNARLLKKTN
jgi:hypothetical protein